MPKISLTKSVIAGIAGLIALSNAPAYAHPGSHILTAGIAKTRTAMTPGMTYYEVAGVHVFTGKRLLAGGEPDPFLEPQQNITHINITIEQRPYRSFRHLRTQGFYSGNGPKSRRFTQGFYSGN